MRLRWAPWSMKDVSRAWKASSWLGVSADSSCSPTKILPALGRNSPPSSDSRVDLPEPGRSEQADHLPGARR